MLARPQLLGNEYLYTDIDIPGLRVQENPIVPARIAISASYAIWLARKSSCCNWPTERSLLILIIMYCLFTCIFVSLSPFAPANLMLMLKCVSLLLSKGFILCLPLGTFWHHWKNSELEPPHTPRTLSQFHIEIYPAGHACEARGIWNHIQVRHWRIMLINLLCWQC